MAAPVSVSTAGKEDSTDTGLSFAFRPTTGNCDLAVEQDNWMTGDQRYSESVPEEEDGASGRESQRRVEEDLKTLSTEEIESRLERTRREFYNRRKIIIKNLPADITNQEVHELLGNYDLKYCFVDKYKGTAFVTLLNGEQAQCAIKEFHQHLLRDREISVQLQPTDALLCIANLPQAFTQQQFEELVRPFGNLERCFLVYSATTGHSKGYGFVEYMKKDSAARAKSELLGKQLGSRMLYVHWTEVGTLTYPLLHSKCLCVDRLPASLLTAQDIRGALADTHAPVFCQLAQGQDGSFRRFAVLEFTTAEMAEEAQRLTDGRLLGGTHIRVSFCAPGPPGRSMLAALIAAQTMAVNRGKGLLPDPTAIQILSGLNNPATLKMLFNPLLQGNKQGLLGAAPAMPLLANPALSAALLQLLLQNQAKAQQAGLIGENPLAALPVQQGLHLLGDLPQGQASGAFRLGLQTDARPQVRQMAPSGSMSVEDSPTSACGFPQSSPPTQPGISMPLMGGMVGADGLAAQGVLSDHLKDVDLHQSAFLHVGNGFASGASCRPHPYRKRLGNVSNQHMHHSMQPSYNLRYQDSYSPEYSSLHQDPLAHLYEQQENLDAAALAGFSQQVLQSLHKRVFSRLIPSPEPSPEGGYVGQHSQGLGGHYADSYLKRKRIF
uniref:Ribonucleoprotein PTB-binding 1 n=1 Tax=Oryzias sinensis TaxID=183150 RepID=A0A8C7XL70_9TELE